MPAHEGIERVQIAAASLGYERVVGGQIVFHTELDQKRGRL
jgi:hypothetical protein